MQVREILKQDALGRVELLADGDAAFVRRVACGGRAPLSRWIARRLLARERRALNTLAGVDGVPALAGNRLPGISAESTDPGRREDDRATLVRAYVDGTPLSRATELPADFFDRLDELVLALHARGVCHNDLHKESNVIVARDGRPWLVDFQLASVHARRGRAFRARAREDLRHAEKHRRRYTRHGRGPGGREQAGSGRGIERGWLTRAWRRLGKPIYVALTRGLLATRDGGDAQRPPGGPWPVWTAPVGPRAGRPVPAEFAG